MEMNSPYNGLSQKAIELLRQMFTSTSLNLPVSVAEQVVEIRNWLQVSNPQT